MTAGSSGAFGAEAFQAATNVSRETIERLEIYVNILRDWRGRMNLIGPGAVDNVWHRHFLDSAQLMALGPSPGTDAPQVWADIGSGAGFPGLVLAILGVAPMHLVEANSKKCAFLAAAAEATGTEVQLHDRRAEDLVREDFATGGPDVITVRAVAPLAKVLKWIRRLVSPGTVILFAAGRNVEAPLTIAAKSWKMTVERLPSVTHSASTILRIRGLQPHGSNKGRTTASR